MAAGKVEIEVKVDTAKAKSDFNELGSSAKKGLESKLAGAGSKALGGLKALGGAAVKGVAAGAAAAGTAIAGIGTAALNAFAEYEQLVGGVDTLFGSASDKLQRYASEAYRTAGMSANQYMQQATSFSAALVQGLKADGRSMEETYSMAADAANTAMTDMADNVNKMGSSMTDVQNAYQGFAKDNYTMLDNLKLGYGGTQAEMARLINDSGVLGDEVVDANSVTEVSFDKIVEAIHRVQQRMGITGTTAKEASETIQGSISMAQAAWQNWLTGIGRDDADMGALTDQLLDSIGAVAANVAPRVAEIGAAILENLPGALEGVGEVLGPIFKEALGQAWNTAVRALSDIGINLPTLSMPLIDQGITDGIDAAKAALEGFFTILREAGETLNPVVQGLMAGLSDGIQRVQPYLDPLVQSVQGFIGSLQPLFELLGAFIAAVLPVLMAGIVQLATIVMTGASQIVSFVTMVVTAVVTFFTVTLPGAIGTLIGFFSSLPGAILGFLGSVLSGVAGWVGGMASNAISAGSQFLGSVVEFISQVPGRVGGFLGDVIGRVSSWVGEMASNAARAATDFGSSLMDGLASIPGRVYDIGSQIIEGIANGVRDAADTVVSAVTGAVGGAIEAAKSFLGIKSPSRVFRREVGRWIPLGAAEGVDEEADALAESVRRMEEAALAAAGVPWPDAGRPVGSAVTASADASSVVAAISALGAHIEGLHDDLGPIIARNAPSFPDDRTMGRLVRGYVA